MSERELGKYQASVSQIYDIRAQEEERKRLRELHMREEKRLQEAEKREQLRDKREIERDKKRDKSNRITLIISLISAVIAIASLLLSLFK